MPHEGHDHGHDHGHVHTHPRRKFKATVDHLANDYATASKLIDRRLWFALHSLGFPAEERTAEPVMPTPRIEAVGARDHWAAERMEGDPLFVPSLDRAMRVIRDAAGDSPRQT